MNDVAAVVTRGVTTAAARGPAGSGETAAPTSVGVGAPAIGAVDAVGTGQAGFRPARSSSHKPNQPSASTAGTITIVVIAVS